MRIRIGYDIAFSCAVPTPMLLVLSVHPDREGDLERPERLIVEPNVKTMSYIDVYGNRCHSLLAPAGVTRFRSETVIRDSGLPDAIDLEAPQSAVEDLPPGTIQFVLGSRYCETDLLMPLAWELFGGAKPGAARVQAICDYAHQRIKFDYMQARATRSAFEANREGVGVCRDYAHLAVALCRCMNIPARYCTGYLGDIGVPLAPYPMDFSAWFEAYVGGRWMTFDARHNTPRIGRVVMGRGRDASDVAIATIFGNHRIERFDVVTDELPAA